MNIASPILVSLMFIDLMQPLYQAAPVVPDTRYEVSGNGELTISVSHAGSIGSVPKGATRIPFLTVNFSASCESDIKVSSLTLDHAGLGSTDDIAGLYAVDGFTRVSRVARFDRQSRQATLRFRAFTLLKCSAAEVIVYADMNRDAVSASEHTIGLRGVASVDSSAQRTVLKGNQESGTLISAPVDTGTLTARLLPVSRHLRYGRNETVARLQLTADTKNSHLLQKITFTNDGSARDMHLQWLTLETLSGTILSAPVPRMRGTVVTLNFSPTLILHAGQTRVFNLKADIRGSQSKTVNFILAEPSDLTAIPTRER